MSFSRRLRRKNEVLDYLKALVAKRCPYDGSKLESRDNGKELVCLVCKIAISGGEHTDGRTGGFVKERKF